MYAFKLNTDSSPNDLLILALPKDLLNFSAKTLLRSVLTLLMIDEMKFLNSVGFKSYTL